MSFTFYKCISVDLSTKNQRTAFSLSHTVLLGQRWDAVKKLN